VISEALRRLGAVSAEYEQRAREYGTVADAAARAEAEHRKERAKCILWHKGQGEKLSQAEAETRAEADDHVAGLYLERMVTAAAADAARAKLHQLREQTAVGRSFVAAERVADQIHATESGV
jgi:hypothetical protein